jgi:hypothetical protein
VGSRESGTACGVADGLLHRFTKLKRCHHATWCAALLMVGSLMQVVFRTINPQLGALNHNRDHIATAFRDAILPFR